MRSSERTKLISDYPLLLALTYVCPTLICVSRFVHYVKGCVLSPSFVCLGRRRPLAVVLVVLQMILVGSITSYVSIGLTGRDDDLGISGIVTVFTFSHSLFFQSSLHWFNPGMVTIKF